MSLIPGQMIHNRYKVITLLGQGGMGSVYEAMDLTLNVPCAVKEMEPYPGTQGTEMPQLRQQFRQEARLLAELRHPNVPRVTDHFEEDGKAYLVMDFIYGRRLDEIIVQHEGLPTGEVLGWARQLMDALAYCHERGVIHRDVKPQNVIIRPDGQAVLVDFGLAKLVDPNDPRTRTVMRGLGTPEYAPPEQYDKKKGRTDPRTDIYSLGATLYHALVGEPPPAVPERVVDPKSLVPVRRRRDDVSKVTDQVLLKAMALQPPQRFQSIAEMYESLFGLPLLTARAKGTTPGLDTTLPAEPSERTVLLPWARVAGLRIDRRLGVLLALVSLVALVVLISSATGRVSGGSVPTATATPTTSAIMTATHTPTATPSPSATPTITPTSIPPTRLPIEMPEGFILPTFTVSASPTPTATMTITPTPTFVVLPSTPTPVPPTDTPPPPPTRKPEPQPQPPPPTSVPTAPPPPPPTDAPAPPPTEPPPARSTPTPPS